MGSIREVKLCLLGDSGVGKSSIVHRFVYDSFRPAMESTIGAAFLTKSVTLESVAYKYQIWDTAGQEKYRALAPMYYRGAAAAIIVYDITREQSFDAVKMWIKELKQYAEPDIVLAIAGNKCDLEDLREISTTGLFKSLGSTDTWVYMWLRTDASEYANLQHAIFVETSAKTAVNIASCFNEISKRLSIRNARIAESGANSSTSPGVITPRRSDASKEQKRSCCSSSS